jgi:ABC-2 type transport system permease protein
VSQRSGNGADRGAWRLVAWRDLWVRLRERSFIVSTLINLSVISVLIVLRGFSGGGTPSYDLGVVGESPVADRVAATAALTRTDVTVHRYDDAASATAALRDGSVDAVLDGTQVTGLHTVPSQLNLALQAAEVSLRIEGVIQRLGGDAQDVASLSDATPLDVGVLEAGDPHRDENGAIAFIGVLLLYGQLFGYGVWVASGVIEEKASRVVELLLSTIRARQLMLGKIVGIGLLGLGQLAFIASFAITLAVVMGIIHVPLTAIGAAGLVLGYFILGYAFYASLFAVAGSLVTRMEELQNALVPINLVILVSFIISIGALQSPDGTLVRIASILPTSSALAMPIRIVLGSAAPWEIALSIGLLVGCAALFVPLAGRLYAGAVLRTGARVKLREAWRASA